MRILPFLAATLTLTQCTSIDLLVPRSPGNQSQALSSNQSNSTSGHSLRIPLILAVSDPNQPCSKSNPCDQGCCNHAGYCGFGPSYCSAANCTDTCDAQAECGPYAPEGQDLCPLNVCCSKYGFCGTSDLFCGDGCQNGCDPVDRPSCGGSSATQRYMGYYESWSAQRPCDAFTPEDLDSSRYTHLYYAFALIGSDGSLTSMNSYDEQYWKEFTGLKSKNPSLKTIISVGGWDAGGEVFSDLAADSSKTSIFVNSALSFMKQYGFDGIDIDWEYPVAEDRGGSPADKENFVSLLEQLKSACGSTYAVTITIPSSYWYMRGFDIVNLEKHIDWFNFMSYDIHGVWDGDSPYTQRVVNPHTNLTEISTGLDLLWRNHIDPSKVALGLGFYGRSFTLPDPACNTPGCPFAGSGGGSGGGNPGKCTQVSGTLSDFEIADILALDNPTFTYNEEAAVNWITWDNNQWVSFDDNKTLAQKEQFANDLCLSGQFAWAVDLGGPGSGQTSPGGGSGNGSASGDVYISPDIWSESNPTIACYPPCTFILPPYPLSGQSTLSFPPYTTSLEVAWTTTITTTESGNSVSTITTIGRTIETTVLTIPANTQSSLDVWNWPINNTAVTKTTYYPTSSILPPPFIITDDANPESSPGVNHPTQTRNVTVPPSPYSDPYTTTSPDGSNSPATTSSTTVPPLVIFPTISFTVGPPTHTCTAGEIGCGHKCHIFCDQPCLINCGVDGGFTDPDDPDCPDSICPPDQGDDSSDEGDDPENDDPEDDGDDCDPDLSDDQGLCDNGNFPLYNPYTRKIDCSLPSDDAQYKISACQAYAMNNPEDMQAIIDAAKTCPSTDCSTSSKRRRSIWDRFIQLFRRAEPSDCPTGDPPAPPTPTYTCRGADFPNVCANAKSAIDARRQSNTMTRAKRSKSKVGSFWNNKVNSWSNDPKPDHQHGWGLTGCNVEEYPFGSGNPNPFVVNRLIPEAENDAHGKDFNKNFLRPWDYEAGDKSIKAATDSATEQKIIDDGRVRNQNNRRQFVIEFDGVADASTEWGLQNNALDNICARPYGVEFLLVGGPPNQALSWDPYFTTVPGRLRTYTRTVTNSQNGKSIKEQVSVVPPQYCTAPSPGRLELVNGVFQSVNIDGTTVGAAKPAPTPGNLGVCEPWPQPVPDKIKVRDEAVIPLQHAVPAPAAHGVRGQQSNSGHPRHAPALNLRDSTLGNGDLFVGANVSTIQRKHSEHTRRSSNGISARQAASGSYLDPNVYAYIDCGNDDIDPCEWGADCSHGDGSAGDDSGDDPSAPVSTTKAPTTTSMSNTKPPASTTKSTSSNCKVCIGVVGTPVSCSYVNGCTPTAPTSSPPPPPPPPPPPSTPPAPKQTSSNNKGSGLCASLGDGSAKDNDGQNMCQIAYSRYLDDYLYTQYTSYTFTADDAFNTALSVFFKGLKGLVGQEGCTAYFKCNSDEAYAKGMTGKQIKAAYDNLFANDKVKVCGSSYLDNGCHVTVNGCNNCEDVNVVCSTKAKNCDPDEAKHEPSDNDSS